MRDGNNKKKLNPFVTVETLFPLCAAPSTHRGGRGGECDPSCTVQVSRGWGTCPSSWAPRKENRFRSVGRSEPCSVIGRLVLPGDADAPYSQSSAASGCGVPRGGGIGRGCCWVGGWGESQVASGVLNSWDAPHLTLPAAWTGLSENKIGDEVLPSSQPPSLS